MYKWGVVARKPCGHCPHSVLRTFQIPVGRQWRWCDFGDQEVGQTGITLTDDKEWKCMCYICMSASNSWIPCSTLSWTASLIPRSKFKFEWSLNERAVTTYNTHLHIWCMIELDVMVWFGFNIYHLNTTNIFLRYLHRSKSEQKIIEYSWSLQWRVFITSTTCLHVPYINELGIHVWYCCSV